jgi:hypothetical protein
MGPLGLALALSFVLPQSDTLDTYRGTLTRALVERAMARHRTQDTLVNDYQAKLRFRLSLSFGRRRWARVPTVTVEEQEGIVQWRRPNDLRLDIVGRRARSRSAGLNINSMFDRPWFVPRGLSDSVRIFGNDFPERAALHPLALDGPDWYSYELTDSVTMTSPGSGPLKLYLVKVQPKKPGPSLIAGSMMLDAATAEVVRLTFRYVGTLLWIDSDDGDIKGDTAKARKLNALVNRIVSVDADLEYARQDDKYWMPYRQLIAGRVQLPMITDVVVPFEIVTSFQDYSINTGHEIVFTQPLPDSSEGDSLEVVVNYGKDEDTLSARTSADRWEGGRYEVHRAPQDSLVAYGGWGDSLKMDLTEADDNRIQEVVTDLARLSEELPDELTGRRQYGVNYERFADIIRYNRVQGLSLGLGYQVRAPMAFTNFQGTARFGFSDERLTAKLSMVRDAPGGTLTLSGYREVREIESFTRNFAFGNSLNAIFAAHDNADYYLAQGGGIEFEHSLDRGLDLTLGAKVEYQSSVETEAESGINDLLGGSGKFPLNPPVLEGTFVGAAARLEGQHGQIGWSLTADGLAGEGEAVARLAGEFRQRIGTRRGLSITVRSGIASDVPIPQALFRAGGLRTVRGYDYGTHQGQAFWSVQTDLTLSDSWGFRPVVFLDAGQASDPVDLFNQEPLVGAGIGASLLRGFIRFDLSYPVTGDSHDVRFDIGFSASR